MTRLLTLTALALFAGTLCHADVFKSQAECVIGKRVADKSNRTGKIIRAPKGDTMCFVRMDDTGKEGAYIFWMLRAEGASVETDDKLVPGVYECFEGAPIHYTFMDIQITGATTYSTDAGRGNFRLDPATKNIVFQSGPLVKSGAKLKEGPTIGLNHDGGSFYGTLCTLKKK